MGLKAKVRDIKTVIKNESLKGKGKYNIILIMHSQWEPIWFWYETAPAPTTVPAPEAAASKLRIRNQSKNLA